MRILSMSGFVPEHICDTVRFTQYTGDRNISHYCGYASDFISQVMMDDSIDGAVYPKSCDSTRIITSYLSCSGKFLHQINVPAFSAAGAEDFFAASIRQYKEALEENYKISIHDVEKRSQLINTRNNSIRKTYENISELSYTNYLEHIHEMLKCPLVNQKWKGKIQTRIPTDKRVYIIGSFLSNTRIPLIMEEVGLTVVGDTLPESGRLVSMLPVESTGDIYKGVARSILSARLSPTQNDFQNILKADLSEIKRKLVRGVVFIMQKYCEPYEYLYSTYKSELDSLGIAALKLSLSDTEDHRKAAIALEAFADTL